jgi:hypothetical protein
MLGDGDIRLAVEGRACTAVLRAPLPGRAGVTNASAARSSPRLPSTPGSTASPAWRRRPAPWSSTAAGSHPASPRRASTPTSASATRRVSVVNSMRLAGSRAAHFGSGSGARRWSQADVRAARPALSSHQVALTCARASANSMRFSRRLGCLISPARTQAGFRGRHIRWMSWAPVFTPMPGTPGTLSTLNRRRAPARPSTLPGGTPNFSIDLRLADLDCPSWCRSMHHDVVDDKLHQVLVGGRRCARSRPPRPPGVA